MRGHPIPESDGPGGSEQHERRKQLQEVVWKEAATERDREQRAKRPEGNDGESGLGTEKLVRQAPSPDQPDAGTKRALFL